ncbi:body wall muscle protein HR-29-like [Styela clava]|uniref:body wall muscle protein HR-29-like n=1 Tax=Styela clava TaxID=7725 RepID=UPI0019393CE4|nr:body wall muscle protein HR-29-like [Styela clava]
MALTPFNDFWSSRRRFRDPLWDVGMTSRDLMGSPDLMASSSSRDWMTPYTGRRRDIVPFGHRSEQFFEMERKFEEMVRRVDSRFSGILSLLDDEEFFGRQQVEVEHEGKQEVITPKAKDFSLKVDVQDFRPEEVKVKVQGGQVFVHAKRENKNEDDGMYAYSFREFKRAFTLPQGVDAEKLTSSLTNAGVLQIDAPTKVCSAPAIEASRTGPVPVSVEHADK